MSVSVVSPASRHLSKVGDWPDRPAVRLTLTARGTNSTVKWRKRIQLHRDGLSVDADINVAMTVNTDKADSTQEVCSVSHARVVQDSRRPPVQTTDADASKPSARSTDD